MRLKFKSYSWFLAMSLCAGANAQVSGTLESYFQSDRLSHGFAHVMTWGEINARVSPNFKGTFSFTIMPTKRTYDEASVTYDSGPVSARAGRMRTSFGFSNWSDIFYEGINHVPMVMIQPLSKGLRLIRDDSGVELTTNVSGIQLEAAAVDTRPTSFQVGPEKFRAITLRAQGLLGGAIVGLDVLNGFIGEGSVYGADLRWTGPHFVVRGEYMQGVGDGPTASGYFANIGYRVPRLPRLQLIVQTEGLRRTGKADYHLHTLGARYIPLPNITLIGNYAWGNGDAPAFVAFTGTTGWSMRALFQIHF